jgi:hypothetical protein
VFIVGVSHNSFPNSSVVHNRQNQCCALAWGSCAGFYCSKVLGLCPVLEFFSAPQGCENVESQSC